MTNLTVDFDLRESRTCRGAMRIISILIISVFALVAHAESPKKIVVLVPGYFNSLAPGYFRGQRPEVGPYWSIDIIRTFQVQGFPSVYVVNNLNPFGTIVENSNRLREYLNQLHQSLHGQAVEYYLVGHSAGGLYSLTVASSTQLPIKKVVSISTPLAGASIVDSVYQTWFGTVAEWLSLDSIRELTETNVKQYLSQFRLPEGLQYYVYGGYQPSSIDFLPAENLSFPFYVTSKLIGEASDGVISYRSATDNHFRLQSVHGNLIQTFVEQKDYIHLDHSEQVLDYRICALLGTQHPEYIQQEQIRFYSVVAKRLLAP
jgi:hypothetical protein